MRLRQRKNRSPRASARCRPRGVRSSARLGRTSERASRTLRRDTVPKLPISASRLSCSASSTMRGGGCRVAELNRERRLRNVDAKASGDVAGISSDSIRSRNGLQSPFPSRSPKASQESHSSAAAAEGVSSVHSALVRRRRGSVREKLRHTCRRGRRRFTERQRDVQPVSSRASSDRARRNRRFCIARHQYRRWLRANVRASVLVSSSGNRCQSSHNKSVTKVFVPRIAIPRVLGFSSTLLSSRMSLHLPI